MSLLTQDSFAGWFLDSPSHWSTQTLCITSFLTSQVYNGRNLMWFLVPTDTLQRWLEDLKPSGARCYLWSAWPSVFFLIFTLSIYFVCFLCVFPSFFCSFMHGFKAIRAHGYLIPLLTPSDHLLHLFLEFPISTSSSDLQGVASCPPTNCTNLLHRFGSSIISCNESSATFAIKSDLKFS